MKISLDFDSILFPLLTAMHNAPGFDAVSYEACDDWDDLPILCGGIDQMLECFDKAMAFEHMDSMGEAAIYPGAVVAVQELYARGVEVHIVTDRPGNRMDDTERLLISRDIPFTSINKIRAADKPEFCIANDIQVIIDDHPLTLAEAASYDMTGLALNQLYSARIARRLGFGVFDNWTEMAPAITDALNLRYAHIAS